MTFNFRSLACAVLLVVTSAFASLPAQAALVINQNNLAGGPPGTAQASGIGAGASNANSVQIFTAGKTSKLARVDLQVQGANLAFSFLSSAALPLTDPANPIIFSPAEVDYTITSLDLSAFDFQVVAGQQYSLFLRRADSSGNSAWVLGPEYAGGAHFRITNADFAWTQTGSDRGFATWVDEVSAVPEPKTWAMMLLGFIVIGCAQRRKKRLNIGTLCAQQR